MELPVLIAIACVLLAAIFSFKFFLKPVKKPAAGHVRPRGIAQAEGGQGRAQMARNQRARMRANVARQAIAEVEEHDIRNEVENDSDDDARHDARPADRPSVQTDDKMGAKKRAKLEAKAEKRAHREAEEQLREEKKQRDALHEEERKKQEEKEKLEEKKREEEERKALEEKARKEHEEYLAMKAAFSVDDEGFDEDGEDSNQENLLKEFINYIQEHKVVIIEDLASQFKMKTQDAIARISDLQADKLLTGVIDDRGKFIYISQEELEKVAKFIKQRGRVSIADLAENSNQLINMSSVKI